MEKEKVKRCSCPFSGGDCKEYECALWMVNSEVGPLCALVAIPYELSEISEKLNEIDNTLIVR